jgi:hypothetical protein
MILKDIEKVGEYAVTSGGFGDVWKALLAGQMIAVKVLKVYQKSDLIQLLKVNFGFSCRTITDLI